MRTSRLSEQQRRIIEEKARQNGFSCYFCRSTEPRSSTRGNPGMGGFMVVVVECASCGNGSSRVRFSAEEVAKVLELDHGRNMRRLSETDSGGRAPGGR